MPHYENSSYKILQLERMPPVVFGETYVVAVGIHTSGPYFKGEWHIVSQRPEPHLESGSWRFERPDVPPEVLNVNVGFMVEQSIDFARNRLYDRLVERAKELEADRLLGEHVALKECEASPFVGCWIRRAFNEQLVKLSTTTESASLHAYLHALRQITPIDLS